MARTALTDARIGALRPRKIAYDIRDGKLGGFGVRVLPSGRKRFFVHSQHRGDRVWKILGDAATMSVDEARSSAVRTLAAIRRGEDPPRDPAETLFEAVAEIVFERYRRLWKPRTLDVNRCYLKNQILPRFQGRQVADIGAPHRLAVAAGPERSRRAGPDRTVGVPGGARQRAEEQGLARRVLGHGSCRSRVARRSPARPPPHACQHRPAAR